MISIGMIFQYDETLGSGLVMLSGGEQKTFNRTNWVDNDNEPSIGQKISYEDLGYQVQIKVANEDDKISATADEEKPKEVQEESGPDFSIKEFDTVDEYVDYYIDMGFKLVSDKQEDNLRTANLRVYTPTDYGEATIKQDSSKISVVQVINGKKISNA